MSLQCYSVLLYAFSGLLLGLLAECVPTTFEAPNVLPIKAFPFFHFAPLGDCLLWQEYFRPVGAILLRFYNNFEVLLFHQKCTGAKNFHWCTASAPLVW